MKSLVYLRRAIRTLKATRTPQDVLDGLPSVNWPYQTGHWMIKQDVHDDFKDDMFLPPWKTPREYGTGITRKKAQKRPPKKMLDDAVEATRKYLGSQGARGRDQEKLYDRMIKAINKVEHFVESQGYDSGNVYDDIIAEAERLGPVTTWPGKDY